MPILSDAQPPAPPALADQPRPAAPGRLPLLWVICVYMGLVSIGGLAFAFAMSPVWAFVYGGLAVLYLAVAAALWLRLRPAWYVAIALLGIGTAWSVLLDLLSGHPHLAGLPIGCVFYLAIALYLWKRRGYFGQSDVSRPRLVSVPGIFALGIVLVFGGGFLLLMTVDDSRQSFPELEVQVPVPPEQENGFLLMEQMQTKWAPNDHEQFNEVCDNMPKESEAPSPEWVAKARAVMAEYQDYLVQTRELVKKPHFVEVPRLQGIAWVSRDLDWLSFTRATARLLVVSAEVQAADGHAREALEEAGRVVALGLLVSKESSSLIQHFVGMAVTEVGLRGLRDVAAAAPDAALLKAQLGLPLHEEELRVGFNLGMAGEFQGDAGMYEDLRTGGVEAIRAIVGGGGPGPRQMGFFERHMRVMPLIKTNMTRNLFGRLMLPHLVRGDVYAPPRPDPLSNAVGVRGIARELGWLHFARNPIGDMLIPFLMPATGRAAQEHFREIAQIRVTQLFLALRCYQLEHGKLPAALEELAPEYLKAIPLDPFTGRPFGYEPGGQKPRIWSVGPDQRTDPPDAEYGDDVVVELDFAATPAPQ